MAAALIDRLLHHCHIIHIRGNSYRLRKHSEVLAGTAHPRRSRATYQTPKEKPSGGGEN
jgi:hypothetical protein